MIQYNVMVAVHPPGFKDQVKWVRVGAAFDHGKDDGRIDVVLDALPVQPWDGQLFLYPRKGKDD